MTSPSQFQTTEKKLSQSLRLHLIWLASLCVMMAWWGFLAWKQSSHILELEQRLGLPIEVAHSQWAKTERMLIAEGLTFGLILLAVTILLFRMYVREQTRAKALHVFFASVTHELRTPMTGIRLQAESIADQIKDPQVAPLIRRLLEDTERLEGEIDKTLELARIEGGGDLVLEEVEFKPWLDRFCKQWLADRAHLASISVRVSDVVILGDRASLQVVFRNLFENALKHSRAERLSISVDMKFEKDRVWIELRDNGKILMEGSYSESSRNLGELFKRGPDSQGAGIGLYLVKQLMIRMQGLAAFRFTQQGFEARLGFKHIKGAQ